MEDNPYAPPEAKALEKRLEKRETGYSWPIFPPLNSFVFGLFALFSFGLYVPYWHYSRAKILNEYVGREVTGLGAYAVATGLAVLFLFMRLASAGAGPESEAALAAEIVSWVSSVYLLVMNFRLRGAVHRAGSVERGPYWLSGLMTFFFGSLYMQIRFNKINHADVIAREDRRERSRKRFS